jgi:hypothetical protein
MFTMHPRSGATERDGLPGTSQPGPASYLIDWRASLRLAERACCCSSRPAVVVIMPPGPGRPAPAELFLCRHHYLRSQQALVSGKAAVFDATGVPLTPHTRSLVEVS